MNYTQHEKIEQVTDTTKDLILFIFGQRQLEEIMVRLK